MRLIDADALFERFLHNPNGTKIRGDANVEVVLVRQFIRYAPTVDVEHLTNRHREYKWILNYDCMSGDVFKCSACDSEEIRRTQFCPSCGAKMKLEGGVSNEVD